MGLRMAPGLLLLALATAAQGAAVPRQVRAQVEADLAARSLCVPLPQGEYATPRPAGVILDGYRAADGFLRFPDRSNGGADTIRATYDLFVTLGLFTMTELDLGNSGRRVRRLYRPTPAGRAYYRTISPSHGAPDWQALCVGRRRLVTFRSPGAVNRVSPCEESRQVTYLYRFENLPAWMDDPMVWSMLPALGSRRDAARPREGFTELVRYGGRWQLRRGDPLVRVTCLRRR